MDIEKFMNLSTFFTSLEHLLIEMKEIPKVPGTDEIRYPGERRKRDREQRQVEGIELTSSVESELTCIGDDYNVPFPESLSVEKI